MWASLSEDKRSCEPVLVSPVIPTETPDIWKSLVNISKIGAQTQEESQLRPEELSI